MRILTFIISIKLAAGCSGSRLSTAVGRDGQTITVMTYNIHHCNPPSRAGLIDLDSIAGVINRQHPDIVALQEVDVNTRRSGGQHQAAMLASKTGMRWSFFKAIDFDGGEYGVAILSKFPITDTNNYSLPLLAGSKGEARVLGTAILQLPAGKKLMMACTHLDHLSNPDNRIEQTRYIREILQSEQLPIILAGDFNDTPGSRPLNILGSLFTGTCTSCPYTIPVLKPAKTIDFITYSPSGKFEVVKHEVIREQYASDHLPVLSVLSLK